MIRAMIVLVLGACAGDAEPAKTDTASPTNPTGPIDADGDGFDEGVDCDDAEPTVYPGAPETWYDGIDADCAGDSDFDADGDGFDSDLYGGGDCDDDDSLAFPGGSELCDGRDGDCDGQIDSPPPKDAPIWYLDDDGDTHGDPLLAVVACGAPADHVDLGDDCDDSDASTYPGAPAIPCDGRDNDCDPLTFEAAPGVSIGGTAHPSLGDAVGAAAAGAVVELCEGLHTVSGLVLSAELELRGAGSPELTRIEPSGAESVITIQTTAPITLAQLTVAGGGGSQVGDELRGGGLLLPDGANVTLEEVIVEGNQAEHGAGIYGGDAVILTLSSTQIRDNLAVLGTFGHGGGLSLGDGAQLSLSGSAIVGNHADFSCGGIDLGAGGHVTGAGGSEVSSNDADLNGGGICATFGGTVEGLRVAQNQAVSAAGIDGLDLVLRDLDIEGNVASLSTGGVQATGQVLLERVTLDANEAGIDVGGMSILGAGSVAELVDCTVTSNLAGSLGDIGGLEVFGATLISTGTDWGATGSENLPTDVGLIESDLLYDTSGIASFVCDDALGTCQ